MAKGAVSLSTGIPGNCVVKQASKTGNGISSISALMIISLPVAVSGRDE